MRHHSGQFCSMICQILMLFDPLGFGYLWLIVLLVMHGRQGDSFSVSLIQLVIAICCCCSVSLCFIWASISESRVLIRLG